MCFFRQLMKCKKICVFNLFLIFCLTALIGLGCSSGGGGDDDDNGGSTASVEGVWKLKTMTKDCDEDDVQVITFPYDYMGLFTVDGYVKLSANTILYYADLSDIDPRLEDFSEGFYYCSEEENAYSTSDGTITSENDTPTAEDDTATYTVSENTLTLVSGYEDTNCTVTVVLDKSSESVLSGAMDNCGIFGGVFNFF